MASHKVGLTILEREEKQRQKEARQELARLHKEYPGTRPQFSVHHRGVYSAQFFDRKTGRLVADRDILSFKSNPAKGWIPCKAVKIEENRLLLKQ